MLRLGEAHVLKKFGAYHASARFYREKGHHDNEGDDGANSEREVAFQKVLCCPTGYCADFGSKSDDCNRHNSDYTSFNVSRAYQNCMSSISLYLLKR